MSKTVDNITIAKCYGNVVSSNMKDKDYSKFVNFLREHSFKSTRVKVEPKESVGSPIIIRDSAFSCCVSNWQTMTELEKLKVLFKTFDLRTIINEWLSELPEFSDFISLLSEMSEKEQNDYLS